MIEIDQLLAQLDDPDLDAEAADELSEQLRRFATEHEAQFTAMVRSIPPERSGQLVEVYESLAENRARWGPFLVEELERVFLAARRSQDPARVLESTVAFSALVADEDSFLQRKLRECLMRYLDASVEVVRWQAAWMIGDFTFPENRGVIQRLCEMVAHDPSWRVRHAAFVSLTQSEAIPEGMRLTMADRLRAWLLDPKPAGRSDHDSHPPDLA